ncbi:hypothetical protein ACE7GA_01900 [Roseomonas sp. CCTCC AB2023176]|uniref:hypothetical protein n=1 Tax=Roseomonas sp. CCTCC AB2023176 TaxID=3342640 RepID=UPI0035E338A3
MTTPKFIVGQKVEYRPDAGDMPGLRGTYTITRVLPGDDRDRTYRARGAQDGQERVLREKQLTPVADALFG